MRQPDACVVRITDDEGKTLGTGFLVSTDGLIATCAHVVEGTEPCVAFPGGEPRPAQIVATDPAHDVAILRAEGKLPDDAEPARLGRSTNAYDKGFRSRGYRPMEGLEGIPAKGEVLDAVSECPGYPDVRHMPLVLDSPHIREGMSGAPVYIPDWDLVVGMITAYWDSLKVETYPADRDTALATPAEAIATLWPDIRLCEPPPELKRPPLGVPFQAPAVPRYFVPRPDVSSDLKARLLAEEVTAPGALVVSAVHGLGGIGKTTLVAALAYDSDLQARVPDGILWATLGHQPDVLSLLVGWIQALRDYDFRPTVVESASNHLRTLLHDKACLLVVDDAWQADHVRPFLVGGPRCRVVVTTRDATLARKVSARLYDLDVMTEAQALALLEARLGSLNGNREQAAALAHELGYLPLALELAAAQVEGGISWFELLDTFRQELADLRALDLDEATYRNESLGLSFRMSLERLSPEDQNAFAWLGVPPQDAHLNPAMAATLWTQREAAAGKRLRHLRDKALLKTVGKGHYMIHDLLHDEAKLHLAEQMPLPEAHAILLARYQARCQNDLWHTLPNDGYVHEHLTWHMEQAGQGEAIHSLLQEETDEGRNAWYEVRDRLGQTAGYLKDIRKAWRLAEEEFAIHRIPGRIGLQCRYGLILASLNSVAQNIPSALLLALVEAAHWTPAQGLAYARQIPDPRQRAEVLLALLCHVPANLREQVLEESLAAACAIAEEHWRAGALTRLAPHLPVELIRETLQAARQMRQEKWRWTVTAKVIPFLPRSMGQDALGEILAAVLATCQQGQRVFGLALLSPYLRGELLEEALTNVHTIEGEWTRAEALVRLAPHLPERLMEQALAESQAFRLEDLKGKALVGIFPHLSAALRQQALQAARALTTPNWRARALAGLLPYLSTRLREEVLSEALEAAEATKDQGARASALAALIPYLSSKLLGDTLVAAHAIKYEDWRGRILAQLAAYLPAGERKRALEATRSFESKRIRAEAIARISTHLPVGLKSEALQEALSAVRLVQDEQDRQLALAGLIPILPVGLLGSVMETGGRCRDPEIIEEPLAGFALRLAQRGLGTEALAVLYTVGDNRARIRGVADLAPFLPIDVLLKELAAACTIDWERIWAGIRDWGDYRTARLEAQAAALAQLALQVAERGYPKEALAAVCMINRERMKLKAIVGLAPHLSKKLKETAAHEALTVVQRFDSPYSKANALSELAPHLPSHLLQEAMAMARTVEDDKSRARALTGLIPHLPGPLKDEALQEALAAVRASDQTDALLELVPHLPSHLLQEAMAMARTVEDDKSRARALIGLLPYLPGPLKDEALRVALAAVRAIDLTSDQIDALLELAPHLPSHLLQEAMAMARTVEDDKLRARALTGLILHLSRPLKDVAWHEALTVVQRFDSPYSKANALSELAPHLPSHLLQEAMAMARTVEDDELRARALTGLIPHLPRPLKDEALQEALAAVRASGQTDALLELVPHLPSHLLQEAMAMARAVEDDKSRARALTGLVPNLTALPFDAVYAQWQEILHYLSKRTRRGLLSDLRALTPMIYVLDGEEAIVETFRAIQDVGRWWP